MVGLMLAGVGHDQSEEKAMVFISEGVDTNISGPMACYACCNILFQLCTASYFLTQMVLTFYLVTL